MALSNIALVKALYAPALLADPSRDAALQACLDAAISWVQRESGVFLERPAVPYTQVFDGCDATGRNGEVLYLDPRRPYVVHTGPDLVTVTEDGAAVTVSDVYAPDAGVALINAGELERPCQVVRQFSAWSSASYRNVAVTYLHGFNDSTDLPAFILGTINEVAWLYWQGQNWVGKQSVAVQGQSVSIEKNLSPVSAAAMGRLRKIAAGI